jgi:DNA-binding CsgD family transcriptional regulator
MKIEIEVPDKEVEATIQGYWSLTDREREVFGRLACGEANKVIAIDLKVSQRTIEVHRSRIMKKIGLNTNRASLVNLFRAHIIISNIPAELLEPEPEPEPEPEQKGTKARSRNKAKAQVECHTYVGDYSVDDDYDNSYFIED